MCELIGNKGYVVALRVNDIETQLWARKIISTYVGTAGMRWPRHQPMIADEFEVYGMHNMDEEDIHQTLSNESVGVLGLPSESGPCLRPLSYWFDGESSLYFVYVLGTDSRKVALSERANVAQFLVYKIYRTFNWRSVLLEGTLDRVPQEQQETVEENIDISWRPELFERATDSENTRLYQFQITDKHGIKQLERPTESIE